MRNMTPRFCAKAASQPSSVHSCTGPSPNRRPLCPATLNSASTRPNFDRHCASTESADSARVGSPAHTSAPVLSASSHPDSSSPVAMTSRAPAAAARHAKAAPIPVDPVMMSTLPFNVLGRSDPVQFHQVRSPRLPHRLARQKHHQLPLLQVSAFQHHAVHLRQH